MNATVRGRQDLIAWENGKPDNFFNANPNLQYVLRRVLGDDAYAQFAAQFSAFGAVCATTLDAAAKEEDRLANHPRLERWSPLGERVEQIVFHPNHDHMGRLIWESGITAALAEAGSTVYQMALYYLLGHNGEGGHMCSLACTSGSIRALRAVASPALREKFLPPLVTTDYDQMQHCAQFLTEIQGGSDVGANTLTAHPHPTEDGAWLLTGEKWFCSNINADQFWVTARPQGAAEGTAGLCLFLVPRKLDDGTTNGFHIRRLKDKIGTRTLASAEVDFVDAVAYPVGELKDGFKNALVLLNASRLMNAVACSGVMHRAYLEASTFACARSAFGQPIANYPLVQEAIADLYSESLAATAISFATAQLTDLVDTGAADAEQRAAWRLLTNIVKYITADRGQAMIHRALEVFGGNGAIETFSILPRLYRDMLVLENWEGTHNVLCLQIWRDMRRYGLHEALLRMIDGLINQVDTVALEEDASMVEAALQTNRQMIARMADADERFVQAHVRRLVDALAATTQAALLLAEAQWELDRGLPTHKPDALRHFINRSAHLHPQYNPLDDEGYLARIERLMGV